MRARKVGGALSVRGNGVEARRVGVVERCLPVVPLRPARRGGVVESCLPVVPLSTFGRRGGVVVTVSVGSLLGGSGSGGRKN